VGGRYSLWSAIGLPIALAIGAENFPELLAGAFAMDRHFAEAPAGQNLPLLLGLIDVWYRNFHGFTSRSVAPYHQGLRRLPAYLQQLEMESNGKRVDTEGEPLPFGTSPVVWGEPGTNGQHAYFQMLHQGTDVIPVEFILVKTPTHPLHDLHTKLLANGLAQAQALMRGKSTAEATSERAPTASRDLDALTLAKHRSFPGQPSEHHTDPGSAHTAEPRRADRSLRAPSLHYRRAVGHQQLRPVGRGTGQGAVCRPAAALGDGRRPRWPGCLDGRTHSTIAIGVKLNQA
jgi:hypothetical protein